VADRYWVGGTGNWTDTDHWSTTSGGSGGASYPVAVDNAYINSLTDGQMVCIGDEWGGTGSGQCLKLDWSGSVNPIFKLYNMSSIFMFGDFIGCAGLVVDGGAIYFQYATGSITAPGVNFNAVVIDHSVCTINDVTSINSLYLWGDSSLILASGKTLTINTSFTTSGVDTKTIQSTIAGSPATISKASGTVEVSYCSIKDITATGGAVFNAVLSTDAGGNTGWIFLKLVSKIGGAWKNCSAAFAKVGGAWKSVSKVYVKVGGAWKNQ